MAIRVSKNISSNSFKNEITDKLLTYKAYVYSFKFVQNDIK